MYIQYIRTSLDIFYSKGTTWKDSPLPQVTPGRRRNIARRRAMGGDTTCVPPNFNNTMLSVWNDMWHSMPQSGKISVTVSTLLQRYREHCTAERQQSRHSSESPAALLPVSFSQAKDWLLKRQKAQCQALETGSF